MDGAVQNPTSDQCQPDVTPVTVTLGVQPVSQLLTHPCNTVNQLWAGQIVQKVTGRDNIQSFAEVQKVTSAGFPRSARWVTLQEEIRFNKQDFPFMKLCCLWLMPALFSRCF